MNRVKNRIGTLFLLNRVKSWLDDKCLPAKQQAKQQEFWPSQFTMNNCFVFNYLITKYISHGKQHLSAFVDLSATFERVKKAILGRKFHFDPCSLPTVILIPSHETYNGHT